MKKHLLPAVLSLLVCLCLLCTSVFAEQAGDPVVVSVGQVSYPLSVVQYAVNGQLMLNEYMGSEVTDETREIILDNIREQFIMMGIIENKLMEHGQNDFTEVEQSNYMTYAQDTYEQLWQGFKDRILQAGISDYSDEEITAWMKKQGYTVANLYQECLTQARWSRITALYCPDVTVTEQEILDYYLEHYVEPDRERYTADIPAYEREILSNGYEAFYTPEGYLYVRQIIFPYPESILAESAAIKMESDSAIAARQAAYDELAQAAVNGLDTTPFKAAYDEADAAVAAVASRYTEVMAKAIPLLQPKIDEMTARLQSGISIDTLIEEYGLTGTTLYFHPASEMWTGEARDAAMTLHAAGDISAPVLLADGVGLLYNEGEMPSGPHKLTADEEAALRQTVLNAFQSEAINSLAEDWKKDYAITIDLSQVVIP